MFCLLFIVSSLAEVFEFKRPGDTVSLKFRLDADNINTGFFKALPGSNLTYKVDITSPDHKKRLYKLDTLEENKEFHFSFSNSAIQDAVVTITALQADTSKRYVPGFCQMKFESKVDTFNKKVSKKSQIEPAMFALEHILKKLRDVTNTSRLVSNNIGNLGQEQKRMLNLVVIFSFVTLAGYGAFNVVQLYFMKQYLNEKKYL